jgi:hypothetical protein
MRKKLVQAIFDFASDEIETIEDAKNYAEMTEEELVDCLIEIVEYYRDQSN